MVDQTKAAIDKSQEINNELVDEAVSFINSKKAEYDQPVLDAAIDIGDWVLDKFYDGNFVEATSHDPNKRRSYRALKEREDLEVDAPTLSRMVRVAWQKRFFTEKGEEALLEPLRFSHMVELIRLPFKEVMIETARECNQDKLLSSRQLKKLVTEKLKGIKGTPEKDFVTSFRKTSRTVSDLLKPSRTNFFPDRSHLSGLNKAKRDALEADALRLQRALSRRKGEVDEFLNLLDQYEPPQPSEASPSLGDKPAEDAQSVEKVAA